MIRRSVVLLACPAIVFLLGGGCDSLSRFGRKQATTAEAPLPDPLATQQAEPKLAASQPEAIDPAAHDAAATDPAAGNPPAEQGSASGDQPLSSVTASLSDDAGPANRTTTAEMSRSVATGADAAQPPSLQPTGVQPAGVQLASASGLASAARRTLDAVMASLPDPAAAQREQVASEISAFTPFPFEFELPTLDGQPLASHSAAEKLIVVDIWATWCGPCRKAIPDFVAIQNAYASRGIQVVGITCDSEDPEEVARKASEIAQRLEVNYPLLIDDGTTVDKIPGFRGYPTTLFLTPDGQVLYKVTGMQPEQKLAAILDHLLQQ